MSSQHILGKELLLLSIYSTMYIERIVDSEFIETAEKRYPYVHTVGS